MNFSKNNQKSKFHAKPNFFLYQQNAHFILFQSTTQLFNITFSKNFIGPQRSIGQQQKCNFEFQKFIIKKPDHKKKVLLLNDIYWSVLSPDFFRRILDFIQICDCPQKTSTCITCNHKPATTNNILYIETEFNSVRVSIKNILL